MATDLSSQVKTSPHRFRADIEGMRAIAVGLVLLYHSGFSLVSGGFVGVDVFFVVSGFLITGTLVREGESTGRISLATFYARRMRRLLPASVVVLLSSSAVVLFVLPAVRTKVFGGDIFASAGYFVNWRFAERSIDYLAEDIDPSPVQHFWSLAVEEQFYFIWPLLMVIVLALNRRFQWNLTRTLTIGLSLVALPSFVWSVMSTANNPQYAFFDTTTRIWELSIGAALAIGAKRLNQIPDGLRQFGGWAGLGAIVFSGLVFDESTPWPGHMALAPTLGAAGIILAGSSRGTSQVGRVLTWAPAVWLGGLSYSIYLWHWPILVAARHQGYESSTWGLLFVVLAGVPAWLSQRFIENPVRYYKPLADSRSKSLIAGALLTAIGLATGGVVASRQLRVDESLIGPDPGDSNFGAGILGSDPKEAQVDYLANSAFVPTASYAPFDVPDAYDLGCQADLLTDEVIVCAIGDLTSPYRVVIAGDSKILQWYSALDVIGQERGWRIETMTKTSCFFSDAQAFTKGVLYESCTRWNANVMDLLMADSPDALLTSQWTGVGLLALKGLAEDADIVQGERGLVSRWKAVNDMGIQVIVVLDNPAPYKGDVYECVGDNLGSLAECGFDRAIGIETSAAPVQIGAAAQSPVGVVDLTEHICPTNLCPPVIGGVLVYRQTTHLTDTYVRTLAPILGERLEALLDAEALGPK